MHPADFRPSAVDGRSNICHYGPTKGILASHPIVLAAWIGTIPVGPWLLYRKAAAGGGGPSLLQRMHDG